MLIAAGIGVTPYASVLRQIRYKLKHKPESMKLKKVWFYWSNRDEGAWEWFVELLNGNLYSLYI